MLYAVIKKLDSLREISASMYPEANKLAHIGLTSLPRRSTLSDANARRSEKVFERVNRDLYQTYKDELSSDSRKRQTPKWFDKLQIIDSTTISLFSNLVFKGVGRHPKTGKKKGGIKAHTIIHANEGVPSDIKFTSVAANDSFMLQPAQYAKGDIVALDRGYGKPNVDFLQSSHRHNGDIVTNPPFRYALEFVQKSLELIPDGRKVAMFLRIQFLEGKAHRKFFNEYPPQTVYVATSRIKYAMNGDFEGTKGSAALYAWFVWQKGWKGETVVRWIN